MCEDGVCSGIAVPGCDDGNECTRDRCDPVTGCHHDAGGCDDANPCTSDTCTAGRCVHQGFPGAFCDDGNPCTYPDNCVADPVQGAVCRGVDRCDDGNPCTLDVGTPEGTCICDHLLVDTPCCAAGTSLSCDDGNACTADRCDPASGCAHDPIAQSETCGVGACERTVDACAGGAFQECVPGTPQMEQACNGFDDDCDGATDENDLAAVCSVRPRIMRDGGLMRGFTVMCRLRDRCAQLALLSPLEGVIDPAWVSAADLAGDVTDDVTFPDPATLACTEPDAGPERGIQEDVAARLMDADSVTFAFDRPADGVCSTLDGGRRDLAALLADLPDGVLARVCVASRYAGRPFEGCGIVRVRH
jgi:hypothetical protein